MKSKTKHRQVIPAFNLVAHSRSGKAQLPPPKLLSWLAANAGISMTTAERLWRTACQDTVKLVAPGTSEFYGQAIDRLVELIDTESARRDIASFGFRPWARYQAKLLIAGSIYINSYRQMQQHRMNSLRNRQRSQHSLATILFHHASPAAELPRSPK